MEWLHGEWWYLITMNYSHKFHILDVCFNCDTQRRHRRQFLISRLQEKIFHHPSGFNLQPHHPDLNEIIILFNAKKYYGLLDKVWDSVVKAMSKMLTYGNDDEIVEFSSLQLANGFFQMKTLFEQMEIGDWPAICQKTCPLVEAHGFSLDVEQCTHNSWRACFEFYFEFLGL